MSPPDLDTPPLVQRLSRSLNKTWGWLTGQVIHDANAAQDRRPFRGRLTTDTISSYNLAPVDLRNYLRKTFEEFKQQKYSPAIKISDNRDKYTFEVPAKLSSVQRNEIDRLRASQLRTKMRDELEF